MRLVGSLSEDPRFYPWLSGRGNLRVLLQPLGISQAEIDAAIDRVGLLEVASKKVKTYSHGMRTRLGLAQAICGDPRVLVLDEPTTGLDPVWIRELRRILRDAADSGAAVLLSSHQLTEVEESCDRAVILRDGHVAAQGSLSEIVGSSGWYVVELREEDIPGAIAAFGGIGHERLSHGIRVEADSGRLVNELLASAGIVPESVRPEGSSLEQRFFELLGEDAGRNADSRLG